MEREPRSVFSKIFFPTSHPATGLLLALATSGVGYVARPVGIELNNNRSCAEFV
jgi:hypothetical protein